MSCLPVLLRAVGQEDAAQGEQINLVLEYVEGQTLQDLLEQNAKEGRALPLHEALTIAAQCLEALSRIHTHGIVHRDIKPSNIMLARDDGGAVCAKLMDFGIARPQADDDNGTVLTQMYGSPGTPLYMAPEQIDPKTFGAISPATDIYAMGVMLYQLISGQPPFTGSLTEIFNAHLNTVPPPIHIKTGTLPDPCVDLLKRALAKKPASRLSSVKAFREEILRILSQMTGALGAVGMSAPVLSDPARTVVASDPALVAVQQGGTMLAGATTSGIGVRRKSKAPLIMVGVVVAILLLVGIVLGILALRPSEPTAPEPKTEPTSSTAPAPKTEPTSTPTPAPPASTTAPLTPTPAPPASTTAPLTPTPAPPASVQPPATSNLPAQPTTPPAPIAPTQPPASTAPVPTPPSATPTAAPPAPATPVQSSGSAMAGLQAGWSEQGGPPKSTDTPAPDPEVEPEPEPAPEAPAAAEPAPEEPKPKAAPKKPAKQPSARNLVTPKAPATTKPAPKAPASADDWMQGVGNVQSQRK